MTELRRPEPLDARHDRRDFRSGEPSLDDWLRRFASQNRRRDTAATWVVTTRDDVVIAYACLSMTSVDREAAPGPVARSAPNPVPALLLGRLAVDRRYAGLGVGTALVAHALATAADLNIRAACRAVIVSALNARARAWWERLGFRPFDPDDAMNTDLFLLTTDIEATLDRLAKQRIDHRPAGPLDGSPPMH